MINFFVYLFMLIGILSTFNFVRKQYLIFLEEDALAQLEKKKKLEEMEKEEKEKGGNEK